MRKTLKDKTSGAVISRNSSFQGCGFRGDFLSVLLFWGNTRNLTKSLEKQGGRGC